MIDDSDDELGRSQNSRQEEESEELHYSVAVEDPQNYRELTDAVTPRRSPASQSTPITGGSRFPPENRISQTPSLVLGTPRTPHGILSHSPHSQRSITPSGLPRGDLGRGMGRPVIIPPVPSFGSSAPPTPGTPSWLDGSSLHETDSARQSDTRLNGRNVQGGLGQDLENVYIYGTNVSVQTCANLFRDFVENYRQGDEFEEFYIKQLQVMHRSEQRYMNVDCNHLGNYVSTRALLAQLVEYPQEIIPIMDAVVLEFYTSIYGEPEFLIQVRPFNLPTVSRMRTLDPLNVDQLLSIKGMAIRTSPIIPDLQRAFFRCFVCAFTVDVFADRNRIEEPASCIQCNGLSSMELIHNRCSYRNKQLLRFQEMPDEIPEGETPFTVTIFIHDQQVDVIRPGDRMEITGIFRAVPRRVNPKHRTVSSVYKTYIDAIHFRDCNAGDAHSTAVIGEDMITYFSSSQVEAFEEFANQGNVYEKLTAAFAPSIWEMDNVKKGLLCLLFGGTMQDAMEISRKSKRKAALLQQRALRRRGDVAESTVLGSEVSDRLTVATFDGEMENGAHGDSDGDDEENDRSHVHHRGDINILLCGDPGTSKSQLLAYVHKLSPRGIYTSGKGSSAVGLTASVVRDPETRDLVLESGALVLSDNGICCIDEFDKMGDITRAILHEAMEQQTVSVTKAGIIATLNARTSILASANPAESRYNVGKSVVENINLPPTLLSRFDLIYLVLDKPNAESDRRLARHLVALYHPDHVTSTSVLRRDVVDQSFLRDYITYARNNVAPEISDCAAEVLAQGYLAMRAMGGRGSKTITATPRQLESLIRMSQALAKMRLSKYVTSADVEEAIRLVKVATHAAATDPRTGTIDMDMITTGRSSLDRDLIEKLVVHLRDFFSQHATNSRLSLADIRNAVNQEDEWKVNLVHVEEAVKDLDADGLVQYVERTRTVIMRSR